MVQITVHLFDVWPDLYTLIINKFKKDGEREKAVSASVFD